MKSYPHLEKMSEISDEFISEAAGYSAKRSERRISMTYNAAIKSAAMAACAALALSAAAYGLAREKIAPAPAETSAVEVERSYNERIADGEEVTVETYIGKPVRISPEECAAVGDYTYTLRDVKIGDRLPEGITKSDLTGSVGVVREFGDDGEKRFESDDGALTIGECIDENGTYTGPGNGYKWVFLTIDVTNNSDEEGVKFINTLRLVGGEKVKLKVGDTEQYEYFEEACYQSDKYFDPESAREMAFSGLSDDERIALESRAEEKYGSVNNYLREVFYFETRFSPRETKTIVLGFPVSSRYVYGELFLELNPRGAGDKGKGYYVPVK